MIGLLCLTLLQTGLIYGQTYWKRSLTSMIDFNIGFSISNSNIGKCSLECQSMLSCGSFSVDTYTSTCTGYLTNRGNIITEFSDRHVYFLPVNARITDNITESNTEATQHVVTEETTQAATQTEPETEVTVGGTPAPDPTACIDEGYDPNNYTTLWTHQFTHCGATGTAGPSNCPYSSVGGSPVSVSQGVQKWTVPTTGNYRIDAIGAAGGNSPSYVGGKGAKMSGTFYLSANTLLTIVVGQVGDVGGTSEPGGGGGGSFVYHGDIGGNGLLIAAGGGGGGGEESTHNGYDGQCGQLSLGGEGYVGSSVAGNGGLGYGGVGGTYSSAGAGWLSDGAVMISNTGSPGTRWDGGKLTNNYQAGLGGFGGGGSGVETNGGGGAGGYTGGSGVSSTSRTLWGGAGGGSFNGGINRINTSGFNGGDGYVNISALS